MTAIPYRPSIDGLRAFAILSVFIFHLNPKWIPGGFVGVDVFFVISGFLITSIIHHECKEERFRLGRFYQRRIARIFPAFFVVALTTLFAASWVYSPQDLGSAGANLVAAALSVSNMKSMLQGNYFQVSEDALPYLHYWSLAVEEQYYLIFPVFFLVIFKLAPRHLLKIMALLFCSSLTLGVILTKNNPTWAFFLLPARAWELLAGSILSLIIYRDSPRSNVFSRVIPILGMVMVVASFFVVPEGKSFPGLWALLPVAGTLGVLANTQSSNLIERMLSWGPLVAIGKISYSLYLWHWPVFSLVDYQMYLQPEWQRILLKLLLSITLSLLSYLFIESPARRFFNQPARQKTGYATVAAIILVSCIVGTQVRKFNYLNASPEEIASGGIVFENKSSEKTVILAGDSNASMYGVLLKKLAAANGERFVFLGVAANDPLPRQRGTQPTLWKDTLSAVKKERPHLLFLVCRWESKLTNDRDRLGIALRELSPHVGKIILFTQPPILPKIATRESIRHGASEPFFESPESRKLRLDTNSYIRNQKSEKIRIMDVAKFFEREDGSILFSNADGEQMYHDPTHLSGFGCQLIEQDVAAVFQEN